MANGPAYGLKKIGNKEAGNKRNGCYLIQENKKNKETGITEINKAETDDT